MHGIIEKKITIQNNQQLLIDALVEITSLSKQVLKSALDKGCVWLKSGKKINRVRRVKKPLKVGNEVFIYYNEKILSSVPLEPELLLDKTDYSIWFKPAGVFSHGSKWGDHCSLTRLVEKSLNRSTFLVHRLDRATSGLMIIAHTKNAARELSDLFSSRSIKKTYIAIVEGEFPEDTITLSKKIDGKDAISHATLLNFNETRSLLRVDIETGRKHQIRKHLSSFDYPIIGDRLYGKAKKDYPENLQLQAMRLKFICPINKEKIDIELTDEQKISLN
ncbi:MAG TPA: RluA family pseudouridine synthase [Piscirickettsiaceae bacterium]|nr:RluA family pseudouridine synthase [Piscirickettsiaceae bacterium]